MNKKIVIQEEKSFIAVSFSQPVITDNPVTKTVTAKVNLIADDTQEYDYAPIILWSGEEYDAIGQWTDSIANDRLNSYFSNI